MKETIILIIMFVVAQSETFIRLSTVEPWKTLQVNDSIISTLGRFKATLVKNECQLNITQFNQTTNQYHSVGLFTPASYKNKTDCDNISIIKGHLVTSANQNYIQVFGPDFTASTVFTIDDEGVLRLIGTFSINNVKSNLESIEIKYDNFRRSQKWTRSIYSILVTEFDDYGSINNTRNWTFSVRVNQLTMYHLQYPNLRKAYTFPRINISNTQVFDFNTQTFPVASYWNITYHPRCFEPKQYLNYKAPYVFELDPYWPIVNFWEQGGYRIAQVAYGQLSEFDFMEGNKELSYYRYYSPCPSRTFQYRGQCVAKCPEPYFHEMRGEIGKCILVCQNYTPINITTRICECSLSHEAAKLTTQIIHNCPNGSESAPYGCLCFNNTYFDSKYSLNCVKECPSETLASNGLCMNCPTNCLECALDELHRNFLKCTKCEAGFVVEPNKVRCVKNCINNHGMSLVNGQCVNCTDPKCIDCAGDPDVCKRCDLFYSLYQGKCSYNCQFRQVVVYSGNMSSNCMSKSSSCQGYLTTNYKGEGYLRCSECLNGYMYLSTCVQSCPQGFKLRNNTVCVCAAQGDILVGNTCRTLSGCPVGTFFDFNRTFSCIKCPFGCLSCYNQACTGCYPGYHLFISPKEQAQCLKNNPLNPCDGQYSLQRNMTCIVNNYTSYQSILRLCVGNIANCQICSLYTANVCILCQQQYYLFNNTCVASCPNNMAPFVNLCILLEIESCSIHHLGVNRRHTIIMSLDSLERSYPYTQYIVRKSEFTSLQRNDPIGYIYFIQKFALAKPDGLERHTIFYQPRHMCLKCEDGKGLNSNFSQCLPCPSNCKKCYLALEQSCLDGLDNGTNNNTNNNTNNTNNNTNNNTQNSTCTSFTDFETKKCVESCAQQGRYPEFEDNILYCKPDSQSLNKDYVKIDAAGYQFDGTPVNMVYFVFDRSIQQSEIPVIYVNTKYQVGQSNQSSSVIVNKTSVKIQDGCFIEIQGNFDTYILNFSGSLFEVHGTTPNSNSGLTSQTYGTSVLSTFKQSMQTWLAYIGYVMSISILCLHFVFIGNQLLYKMDNLIIFTQSIYFFLFAKNLVGRLLAQFYFGWSFMHARFLPNLFQGIIPPLYRQAAPCSYKLVNMDGNYFRNAGYSLVWLLIYLACFGIIVFTLWAIRKLKGKNQIWYKQTAIQALMAGIQFFSFNLLFFSMTQLKYSGSAYDLDQSFYDRSQALAIITLTGFVIYTVIRLIYHPAGGVYMIKRFCLAAFIFASYEDTIFLLPVLLLQFIFALVRLYLESPESGFEKLSIFLEAFIFIGCYLLLFLCYDTGVNTIILSIIIFVLVVYLAYDLTTIYLEYKNQYSMKALEMQYQADEKLAVRKEPTKNRKNRNSSRNSEKMQVQSYNSNNSYSQKRQ